MALKASMKILLVSESGGKRQTNRGMLGKIGFKNVVEANDGEKAWEAIQASQDDGPVQMLMVDAELPKVSGIELLKKVRAGADTAKLKVLLVLDEADQKLVVEAAQAKVSGVIVSPFSTNALMEKIGKMFGQK